MCCPTNPEHNELEELRSLLESSAVLEDFDEEPEEGNHDQTDGHVCEECEGCHATNGYLLDCLNHVLSKVQHVFLYLPLKSCLHHFQFLNLMRALMTLQHLDQVLKFDPTSLSVGKRRRMRWSGWTWRSPPRCRSTPAPNRLSLPDELGNLRCFSMCTR